MSKKLIIVESPAKIKTLRKFLGSNYLFESSLGHIRDLPAKGFGIDIENDFEPQYEVLAEKKKVIDRLKQAAKECDTVYLSPDPDREGEAIAWHIASILPPGTNIKRATFHSITKEAVTEALANPRTIDQALVNAQQARRLLDRIVGYKISPILARRIQRGNREKSVSAGRVQSVALKLVVDREKEIEAFNPIEYWTIAALLKNAEEEKAFRAHIHTIDGRRLEKEEQEGKNYFTIPNKETADQLLQRLETAKYKVAKVERKEKRRNPVPPFITSTLQQEASRHYGFSAARTMSCAQSLYEGVELGSEGSEGLITYMRTDSVRIVPEAAMEARAFIEKTYGKEFLPEAPRFFTARKSAQDAHEAIRPASLKYPPEKVKGYLTRDQYLLYELIWKRFVACQMLPAIFDTVSADIETDQNIMLRATGSLLKFPGFLILYEEKVDDEEKEESRILPNLQEGQQLEKLDLISDQSFTKAPPRFSEASLVKELERLGIGRPSTYATIMNKIQSREYTVKEQSRLKPTELGRVIAEFLEKSFQQIMNVSFTAHMEDDLERVAINELNWKDVLRSFWTQFIPTIEIAEKEAFVPKIPTDIECPKCGKFLQKIWARSKYFYGCSGYPDCDYSITAEELNFNKEDYAPGFDWEQKCPNCQSPMKVRHGKFGAFLGCTTYPDCKGIINIPKPGEETIAPEDMPSCVAIGCDGHLVARKSRFGKTFYSCSNYPDCDVIVNDLDQLSEKYAHHEKTAYVKKAKKSFGAKKGAAKATSKKTPAKKTAAKKTTTKKTTAKKPSNQPAMQLSKELQAIVNETELNRPTVTKKVWEYIKANNLQDANNKRLIVPDAALAKVFGTSEPVDMFKMAGLLGKHIK
ncbi:MAG: type I DNA topoisomerase [Parachlamydiales bacterium]|nr:type I DNA topoisomerase [Parachlamydiales bacterium]